MIKNHALARHRRFLTATSLFDGHDASINMIRRILQASGVEVIHLGHNRSVDEVVNAAIQEDVQAICISSYQGGHLEYLKYMHDLLQAEGAGHIKIFAGGGGVIVPKEIRELHSYGICRVFSPDDGREMGLQGMIDLMLGETGSTLPCQAERELSLLGGAGLSGTGSGRGALQTAIARLITCMEECKQPDPEQQQKIRAHISEALERKGKKPPVLGITGTGGAGKSSLADELVRRYLECFPDRTIAVISVDPTKQKTGGALLGDRLRMNAANDPRVYMRSMATRGSGTEISKATKDTVEIIQAAGYDLVIVETSGIGQGDSQITGLCDVALYVMTCEFGASTQLEKIDMIDAADVVVINKFERRGSEDALRDVRKQYRRSRNDFSTADSDLPIFGTTASRFQDSGINALFVNVMKMIRNKTGTQWPIPAALQPSPPTSAAPRWIAIIPAERSNYLSEIAAAIRSYYRFVREQAGYADRLYQLNGVLELTAASDLPDSSLQEKLAAWIQQYNEKLHPECARLLKEWPGVREGYKQHYSVSLSGSHISKVSLPDLTGHADLLRWRLTENVPGQFPFTAGVFPFKRTAEEPKRQFTGEGTPERTNRRFHYLSDSDSAKRLSTAFDSVTLYGRDPDRRPDIYGKIGNSGVSICTIEDMKKLYAGFDLCNPSTSVSMTINGPAPILLAMFLNTAIEQQIEKFEERQGRQPDPEEYGAIRASALNTVRGTVQADILKEDQGQNTCIFSTDFALKMMGDIQQYFIDHKVRNYYSVSISGYHIAEAGANPISQLAFTLANGFTYVEYYRSRGMHIDDFAPNLSFFFSNGLDPEYSVIGRVARRIWAVAIKHKYNGNERSQKLKYHIQTSGRSLHAQEMDFNDIRTTLQALLAIYDNCNSLHTNAYDEAVTTPTEHSVRRAMAIQLIINRELGLAKNENPLQGSFIIEELTNLVEEAVLDEFMRISERGGVLGAMETQYQRGKIQEESHLYEEKKASGELPIIGVNTFINPNAVEREYEIELSRSTQEEKETQINGLHAFRKKHEAESGPALERLKAVARGDGNTFAELMDTVKYASLGQITAALYEVGGQYRRNM